MRSMRRNPSLVMCLTMYPISSACASSITLRAPAAAVCARLHEKFATKHLVITLGEDGMLLSTAGKILKTIPTAAREVYDVSGAGDTALAALVLALAAGAKLETAAHFANAAAGVVVGKLGTATVTPTELKAYVSHR